MKMILLFNLGNCKEMTLLLVNIFLLTMSSKFEKIVFENVFIYYNIIMLLFTITNNNNIMCFFIFTNVTII